MYLAANIIPLAPSLIVEAFIIDAVSVRGASRREAMPQAYRLAEVASRSHCIPYLYREAD
ncbi:hypothetical protein [Nostoc sp. LEGE 12450]|uniref:hypothetical protein n=1 Tax=Nostoc sp. LEGE 12450 TaxID=1828643 RepID=UPI00188266C5|nr:hypothetical protein [Nostoc sp. LEGE 12450]MBE8989003.1 hypothetical protein [Nostoc sp. LEGE 12450]